LPQEKKTMENIDLLDYAVSVIDWMAKTGRVPDAAAADEEECILGGILPAIRARVLQHIRGDGGYKIERTLSFDEDEEDDC
jgi:hypothetical protein